MAKQSLLILTLAMGSALTAPGQQAAARKPELPAARPQVLVLGVYHMSNPGRDILNMKADDVLAPKRQAEIAQLIEVLKKFHPTKIAVEADVWNKHIANDYADYVAGKHELTRNEIEQIGFRLAKELDPVLAAEVLNGRREIPRLLDADGEFPFQRIVNNAKASGRSKELEALMAEVGVMVKAQDQYLATHTVLETLLYMNSDEKAAEGIAFYYRQAHFGEPGDWAGADLTSDWFRRNMRIYSNIAQLTDSPDERVLVIFGAGHLGWLRHDFASDPTFRLRKLADFVK